jgi:hypothetical protein
MKTLAAAALLLAAVACSSGSDQPTMSAQQVAAKVGCQGWHGDSRELFVSQSGSCQGVRGISEIASFNTNEARDNWLAVAKGMGGMYLAGNGWIVAADYPAALKAAQAKVGGTIQ